MNHKKIGVHYISEQMEYDIYKVKYLKYKAKYIKLKSDNKVGGGIGDTKPFEIIDLDLTEKEINLNQKIKIKKERIKPYGYYGKVENLDYKELKKYIEEIGDNDDETINAVYTSIKKIIKMFMNHYNEKYNRVDSVWVAIRPTTPNESYKIPRWHRDGIYYTTEEGEKVYKFVACLKGPTTLFVRDDEKIKAFTQSYEEENEKKRSMKFESQTEIYDYEDNHIRPVLADVIGSKYESVPENKGLIFLVGDPDAVIHSEPDQKTERLFISILPGSEEQIKEWKR